MPRKTKDRYKQLPESFLKYLQRNFKGFKRETKTTQLAVVEMILSAPSKFRTHAVEGARFGYKELEQMFRRKGLMRSMTGLACFT
jgi:hypothetical protein